MESYDQLSDAPDSPAWISLGSHFPESGPSVSVSLGDNVTWTCNRLVTDVSYLVVLYG